MEATHHQHDMSDKVWELLKLHLPGREGTRGVPTRDNRNFLNAVFLDLAYRSAAARFAA